MSSSLSLVRQPIVTIASTKGGVGKSTLALELAALYEAVLVDLDWDTGSVTTALWGLRKPDPRLLQALLTGRTPRPVRAAGRPRLVPGHADLVGQDYDGAVVADHLASWAAGLAAPLVIDTHPGGSDLAYAAMRAADVVVVPVPLRQIELAALDGMLEELRDHPIVLVPNLVPPAPPRRLVDRLAEIARRHDVPIAPPISEHRWLQRRALRRAITLVSNPGRQVVRAADEFAAVGDRLLEYVRTARVA